jgi:hypothetical protein
MFLWSTPAHTSQEDLTTVFPRTKPAQGTVKLAEARPVAMFNFAPAGIPACRCTARKILGGESIVCYK